MTDAFNQYPTDNFPGGHDRRYLGEGLRDVRDDDHSFNLIGGAPTGHQGTNSPGVYLQPAGQPEETAKKVGRVEFALGPLALFLSRTQEEGDS
jgi:hypothetical protein